MKNKSLAILMALLMITSMFAMFATVPNTDAHTPPWTIPTWAYVTASPNPVGVGQQVIIVMWIDKTNPFAYDYAYGDRWKGYTLYITHPDGTNETLGPYTDNDPTGSYYILYTPTKIGTYKIVFNFPGQVVEYNNPWPGFNATTGNYGSTYTSQAGRDPNYVNDTFSASTSAPYYLNVQQQQIQPWPESPLPTEYWTCPINGMNRGWEYISGSWLAGAAMTDGPTTSINAFSAGPESAHVLWTKQILSGGEVGGTASAAAADYGAGTADWPFTSNRPTFTPPIIINGKIYYNENDRPKYGWNCIDLYTGQTSYFVNTTSQSTGQLAFGSVYLYNGISAAQSAPYLWVTSTGVTNQWDVYNAFNGLYVYSIANVSSAGTAVYGDHGDILRYNIINLGNTTKPNYYLQVWNSSHATRVQKQAVYEAQDPSGLFVWQNVFDGRNGFSLNVSIPAIQGTIQTVRRNQYVIGGTPGLNLPNGTLTLGNLWALSLKPGQEGTLLWNITFTPPQNSQNVAMYGSTGPNNPGILRQPVTLQSVDPEDGVFILSEVLTQRWWAYDLTNGNLLWGPSERENAWQLYNTGGAWSFIYQGKLFSYGYGGQLYAYDVKTGVIQWIYNSTAVGFESPYNSGLEPLDFGCIADGKIYMYCSEHSPTTPLARSHYIRCINASNGALIWKIAAYEQGYSGAQLTIGDGYLLGVNMYDGQLYCYGKGPSAITVSAPQSDIQMGSSFTITGEVTDQSPGAKAYATKYGLMNGVAAVSDESQEGWMEYLYEQQLMPTNATGVPVSIDAVDPNGNYIHLGTATNDLSGIYGFTVDTSQLAAGPGTYKVFATFTGSNSYGHSSAESYFTVNSAAPTASPPPLTTLPPTEMYFAISTAAIIIAVAIIGAIVVLVLKKRP